MKKLTAAVLLLLLCSILFVRPVIAEYPQTPGEAVRKYLAALQRGDVREAARYSTARLPVSEWTLEAPMLELVYPSITDVAIEGAVISGDTAEVTAVITHADWDMVQRSDWFGQLYYDFTNWEMLYDETYEDGQTRFGYILGMAKRLCLIREKAVYALTPGPEGWQVDLDATARHWKTETGTPDAPRVSLASFGFIEHDYAQQRYYNDILYANQEDGMDRRADWDLWLRLKADDDADIGALERYSAYALQSMLITADDKPVGFPWTDGSVEWFTRYWMEDTGRYAAIEARLQDGEMPPDAVARELQEAAFTCQAEYWPLSIRCHHTLLEIDTADVVYEPRELDGQVSAVCSHARPSKPGSADTTLADYLYGTGSGYVGPSDVHDLWPGLTAEALSGSASGYTLYTVAGTLSRKTVYPLYDVTFLLMAETEGAWVRRAEQCGICYSIDGCDLAEGGSRDVSFEVLVKSEGRAAKDIQALLRSLDIGLRFFTEHAACEADPHNATSRIGPRSGITADMAGILVDDGADIAAKSSYLLAKGGPLAPDAKALMERYDMDGATAAAMAAHPGNFRHYVMEISLEKSGSLPVWLSGARISIDDEWYGDAPVNLDPDYPALLYMPRIPDGTEIPEGSSSYILDVILYTGGCDTPDILVGLARNDGLMDIVLDCRHATGTGEVTARPAVVERQADSRAESVLWFDKADIYHALEECVSAWENGDAETLLSYAWPQWLAWHPDARAEIAAMCAEYQAPLFDGSARWQNLSFTRYAFPGGTEYYQYTATLSLKSFEPGGGYFESVLYKESGRWYMDPQSLFRSGNTSEENSGSIARSAYSALEQLFASWQHLQLGVDRGYGAPWENVSAGAAKEVRAVYDGIDGTFSAYTSGGFTLPAPDAPAVVPVTAYFADEDGLMFTRELEVTLALDMIERTCVINGLHVR